MGNAIPYLCSGSGATSPSLIFHLLPASFPWGPWESLCPSTSMSSGFIGRQSICICWDGCSRQGRSMDKLLTSARWEYVVLMLLSLAVASLWLLHMLRRSQIHLWIKFINCVCDSNGIYCWWHGVWFFVTIYSSVKPFVQQAYPIQPSVTAPISGNFCFLSPLKRVGLCPEMDRTTTPFLMTPATKPNISL